MSGNVLKPITVIKFLNTMHGSKFDFKHIFDLAETGQIDELNAIITTENFPLHIRMSNTHALTNNPLPKLSTYKDCEHFIQSLETIYQVPLLHFTLQRKRNEVLQYLLSLPKINPNIRSSFGRTPLQIAIILGDLEAVEMLLTHPQTDVNLHDKANLSPLCSAISLGHVDIAIRLIDHPNIDVNLKSTNEKVCLFNYLTSQLYLFKNIKDLLTDKYFNQNLKKLIGLQTLTGSFVESPFALALQNGHQEIVGSILRHPKFVFQPQRNQFYTLGNIDYFGGLLAMSALKAFGKANSNCTLLTSNAFGEYLSTISQEQDHDLDELFVLCDAHWLTGQIKKSTNDVHRVVLLDSLGKKSGFLMATVAAIQSTLSGAHLYVGRNKRQKSAQGCSMFSLDDLQKLFKIENYLPDSYKESGLSGFLENSITQLNEDSDGTVIKYCDLPLYLLKSKQSRTLLSKDIPLRIEESAIYLDKKKRFASDIAHSDFVGTRNIRINRKLEKTCTLVESFRANHEEAAILEKLTESSFAGFKKRFKPTFP